MWQYKVKHDTEWEEQACQGDAPAPAGKAREWPGVHVAISAGSSLKEVLAREAYQDGKEAQQEMLTRSVFTLT